MATTDTSSALTIRVLYDLRECSQTGSRTMSVLDSYHGQLEYEEEVGVHGASHHLRVTYERDPGPDPPLCIVGSDLMVRQDLAEQIRRFPGLNLAPVTRTSQSSGGKGSENQYMRLDLLDASVFWQGGLPHHLIHMDPSPEGFESSLVSRRGILSVAAVNAGSCILIISQDLWTTLQPHVPEAKFGLATFISEPIG